MSNLKNALYPATFTEADIITEGATVALLPGVYTLVGEYVVKADEMVGLGRGGYSTQDQAIGRLLALLYDNSTTPQPITNGKFRIMLMSSQDIPIGAKPVYLDVDLAALTSGATVPADRFVLPFDGTFLSRDKKFQFLIKSGAATTVTLSAANSKILMDVTRALI